MRRLSTKEVRQLFEEAGIGIENSKDNQMVFHKVQDFGHTPESLVEAESLYDEAEALYLTKGPKKGKKINLSIQLRNKIDDIHRIYMIYVKSLRRDLIDEPGLLKELLLVGARDFSFAGKIKEPKEFYKNCHDNHGGKIGEVVLKYGLTPEKLQVRLDSIADVEKDKSFRALLVMDSEKTTEDMYKVIYKLYTWWRNYRDALIYVFRDDPQQLEAFKIKGYSLGYKPKSQNSTGEEPPENPETPETPETPAAEEPAAPQ
jgi:hypothetical protein